MPKMSVYLPDDLYQVVKSENLPVSEILQEALRAKLEVDEKLRAADEFIATTFTEYGEPSAEDIRAAEESARRIAEHGRRREHGGNRRGQAA